MNWNLILFVIFPYIALTLFIVVTVYRAIFRPFTVSSLSSQLLERKQLYWGSISFHNGILLILLGHLLALLFPESVVVWNSVPLRLYLLEVTGLVLALWSLVGVLILILRRITVANIRAVTLPTDMVVLLLLLLSVYTGIATATGYRFGSAWFTGVFSPYLWSILTLQPRPELVAPLPWTIQLHAFNFFILLAIFPFTRLIHIITYPLSYLFRPWQIVVWVREQRSHQESHL
jgi:nitrate reductase gamma subunit